MIDSARARCNCHLTRYESAPRARYESAPRDGRRNRAVNQCCISSRPPDGAMSDRLSFVPNECVLPFVRTVLTIAQIAAPTILYSGVLQQSCIQVKPQQRIHFVGFSACTQVDNYQFDSVSVSVSVSVSLSLSLSLARLQLSRRALDLSSDKAYLSSSTDDEPWARSICVFGRV